MRVYLQKLHTVFLHFIIHINDIVLINSIIVKYFKIWKNIDIVYIFC